MNFESLWEAEKSRLTALTTHSRDGLEARREGSSLLPNRVVVTAAESVLPSAHFYVVVRIERQGHRELAFPASLAVEGAMGASSSLTTAAYR